MTCAVPGAQPLFAAQWALTEINGERGADEADLYPGAEWSWSGEAVRLDHGIDPLRGPLRLTDAIGRDDLRRVAARRALRFGRRVRTQELAEGPLLAAADLNESLYTPIAELAAFRRSFTVTDGRRVWPVARSAAFATSGALALFSGGVPPADTPLWVVTVSEVTESPVARLPQLAGYGIGARVETPFGPTPVAELRPGDPVLTDHGSAPLRRVRLRPGVAALRIEPGALGPDTPSEAVTLGAGTLIAIDGQQLPALFGACDGTSAALDEALIRASDIETVPGVGMVRSADLMALEVDRHADGSALVMANGLACLAGPSAYAPMRCLTRAEAQVALLGGEVHASPTRWLAGRAA